MIPAYLYDTWLAMSCFPSYQQLLGEQVVFPALLTRCENVFPALGHRWENELFSYVLPGKHRAWQCARMTVCVNGSVRRGNVRGSVRE